MSRSSRWSGTSRAAAETLAVLFVATFAAGCHVYEPVTEPPAPGTDVRVHLTAPGALQMSEESDEARRTYEGRLSDDGADTLTLSVVRSRNVSQFNRAGTLRNNMNIPRNYVERVEVRRLSGWRTTGVVAAATGVVGILVYRAAGGGKDSGNGPENGGGPQTIRIPLGFGPTPP